MTVTKAAKTNQGEREAKIAFEAHELFKAFLAEGFAEPQATRLTAAAMPDILRRQTK